MSDKLLKITYHDGNTKKLSSYLRMPSQALIYLKHEIEIYLFQERQLPQREIRIFWLDVDHDEIDIINQNDYEIFRAKNQNNIKEMHLHIASASAAVSEPEVTAAKAEKPASDDPTNFVIHDHVECDSCGVKPLIGFRYKCVQCPDYDLCQRCESEHKHPQHMLLRMPNNNGPSNIDAWITGPFQRGGRCGGRRNKGQCPFVFESTGTQAETQANGAESSHKESRRERRHMRRHGGNVFSHFMEVMANLHENNGQTTSAAAASATSTATTTAPPQTTTTITTEKATEVPTAPAEEPKVATKIQETVTTSPPPSKESQTESTSKTTSTTTTSTTTTPTPPTTPVITMENLAQIVPPEYMRTGIEILNNFSDLFAKILDPSDGATSDFPSSMSSTTTTTTVNTEPKPNTDAEAEKPQQEQLISLETSTSSSSSSSSNLSQKQSTPEPQQQERTRSESLDHDWQVIDNSVEVEPIAAPRQPVPNFAQLSEQLREHITEEQKNVQQSPQTQAPSSTVDPAPISMPANSSAPPAPAPEDEKRQAPIVYHKNERINAAIHAMMAMGFSNEGAWLTQLLESVDGNISAALEIIPNSNPKM